MFRPDRPIGPWTKLHVEKTQLRINCNRPLFEVTYFKSHRCCDVFLFLTFFSSNILKVWNTDDDDNPRYFADSSLIKNLNNR